MCNEGDDFVKAVKELPEGYEEIYSIELQKDKKMSLIINGISLVIAAIIAVPVWFAVPL